jgi:hypothetical protein
MPAAPRVANSRASASLTDAGWFSFGGPDDLDNGLALCALHHKLFDLGALGLDTHMRVQVSSAFTARTMAGRMLYDLDGRQLAPRPGTRVPSAVLPGLQGVAADLADQLRPQGCGEHVAHLVHQDETAVRHRPGQRPAG